MLGSLGQKNIDTPPHPRSKSVILQLLKPTDQFSGQKALQGAVAQSLSLSTGHLKARQPSPEWMVLPVKSQE